MTTMSHKIGRRNWDNSVDKVSALYILFVPVTFESRPRVIKIYIVNLRETTKKLNYLNTLIKTWIIRVVYKR